MISLTEEAVYVCCSGLSDKVSLVTANKGKGAREQVMKVIKDDIADIEIITRKINERRLLFNETICPRGKIRRL